MRVGGGHTDAPVVRPLGEAAVLIELTDRACAGRAPALAARLRETPPAGVLDAVAAYDTVAVYFDPLACSPHELTEAVLREAETLAVPLRGSGAEHVIPVSYTGEDLASVAQRTGLSPGDVAAIHAAAEYTVFAVGFVPGFAYLGELDDRLRIPRRDTPRTRVPAGSVAIADGQTAVYPLSTPGGWHIIGQTDVRMFDPARSPPSLLAVGDRVQFIPA